MEMVDKMRQVRLAPGAHRIDRNKVSSVRANEFAADRFVADTVHTATPADCRLQQPMRCCLPRRRRRGRRPKDTAGTTPSRQAE